MERVRGSFVTAVLLVWCVINVKCRHQSKQVEVSEREKVLKIAVDAAVKEYGSSVIKNELPLKVQLVGDSVWTVEGTLRKGTDGGTVYLEISKEHNEVLKITHYK